MLCGVNCLKGRTGGQGYNVGNRIAGGTDGGCGNAYSEVVDVVCVQAVKEGVLDPCVGSVLVIGLLDVVV